MWTLIKQSVETPLSGGSLLYYLGMDGWDHPPFRRFEEQGPQQHGVTDRGFQLGARTGTLGFQIVATTSDALKERRRDVIRLFGPTQVPVSLRADTGYGLRQIDAFSLGGPRFASSDQDGFSQKFVVQFTCRDPTFYDPEEVEAVIGAQGSLVGLPIPFTIPVPIGPSRLISEGEVEYEGDWETFPIVKAQGPCTNLRITNNETGDKLDFNGSSWGPESFREIDTRYGYKTVVDEEGTRRLGELTEDSDLATFSIVPTVSGVNSFTVEVSGTSGLTEISLRFYTRFLGI